MKFDSAAGVSGLAVSARSGDPAARALFSDVGWWLGRGLALLVDVLNPEAIVIGGIYPRCHDLLEPTMRESLKREALPTPLARCRVLPSALGESIDAFASCSAAAYREGWL